MWVASLGVRWLDGHETTADNLNGRLVGLMKEAGFSTADETHQDMTILGTLSLYRVVVPHSGGLDGRAPIRTGLSREQPQASRRAEPVVDPVQVQSGRRAVGRDSHPADRVDHLRHPPEAEVELEELHGLADVAERHRSERGYGDATTARGVTDPRRR